VTPNVLRHTVATLLAQRGVSMFDIAGLLGNSPVVCARNYAHHSPEYLKGAAAMLG
jgi:site-specific recombinase XerD